MGRVDVSDVRAEPERTIVIKAGAGADLIKMTTTPELAKQGTAKLSSGGEVTADLLREAADKIEGFAG